jgi:hypothetical protein
MPSTGENRLLWITSQRLLQIFGRSWFLQLYWRLRQVSGGYDVPLKWQLQIPKHYVFSDILRLQNFFSKNKYVFAFRPPVNLEYSFNRRKTHCFSEKQTPPNPTQHQTSGQQPGKEVPNKRKCSFKIWEENCDSKNNEINGKNKKINRKTNNEK